MVPSKLEYRWRYDKGRAPGRQKSRVVVRGSHETGTGADKATPVILSESVSLSMALAGKHSFPLKMVSTSEVWTRRPGYIYVIPPKILLSVHLPKVTRSGSCRLGSADCACPDADAGEQCTRSFWT